MAGVLTRYSFNRVRFSLPVYITHSGPLLPVSVLRDETITFVAEFVASFVSVAGIYVPVARIPSMECIVHCDPKRGRKSVDTQVKTNKFRKFEEGIQVSHCSQYDIEQL